MLKKSDKRNKIGIKSQNFKNNINIFYHKLNYLMFRYYIDSDYFDAIIVDTIANLSNQFFIFQIEIVF